MTCSKVLEWSYKKGLSIIIITRIVQDKGNEQSAPEDGTLERINHRESNGPEDSFWDEPWQQKGFEDEPKDCLGIAHVDQCGLTQVTLTPGENLAHEKVLWYNEVCYEEHDSLEDFGWVIEFLPWCLVDIRFGSVIKQNHDRKNPRHKNRWNTDGREPWLIVPVGD